MPSERRTYAVCCVRESTLLDSCDSVRYHARAILLASSNPTPKMSAYRSLSLLNLQSTEQTFSQPKQLEITLCINSKSPPFTFIVLSPLLLQSPTTSIVQVRRAESRATKATVKAIMEAGDDDQQRALALHRALIDARTRKNSKVCWLQVGKDGSHVLPLEPVKEDGGSRVVEDWQVQH
jgi:hypothetical protein